MLIDEDRRKEIYNIAFGFLIDHQISTIPVWTEDLCQMLGIELVKLSDIVQNTGFTKNRTFSFWGNEDGALHSFGDIFRIAYNDEKPIKRQRFTIMEEISHKLLKHYLDSRFNIFSQDYDEATYRRYEEEARMCAGIIICPPQYFYEYKEVMSKRMFKTVYNVSEPCATTRIDVFSKFEKEIKSSYLYDFLPTIKVDKDYLENALFA